MISDKPLFIVTSFLRGFGGKHFEIVRPLGYTKTKLNFPQFVQVVKLSQNPFEETCLLAG